MAEDKREEATRRVKVHFDVKGDPMVESVLSPVCYKQEAFMVLPPHDVIPIVFVPGVAGSNLKTEKEKTWRPPNDRSISALRKTKNQNGRSPEIREKLFDPVKVEVDWDGPCAVPDTSFWLTPEEARRRGWGSVHAGSYHKFLCRLETCLNDLVTDPGVTDPKGETNYLLPEIGLMQYLGGSPAGNSGTAHAKTDQNNAQEAVTWWGKSPRALSDKEIQKLGSYYYPVWVFGYNWLRDPEESANGLLEYLDKKVFDYYKKSKYFKCAGQAILVTHSMGGLIARRAAQINASNILGVVHGVQPVMGAPALYRRFRAGQEAGALGVGNSFEEHLGAMASAAFMGWSEQSMTVQLARAPGPLALAPTKHYPMDWLVVSYQDDRKIFSLPKKDPYEEIYSKTTDDCWWGMVNPAYIDPAGTIREKKKIPAEECRKAVTKAKDFHDKLGLYAHPETYGFYGIDDKKYRSFGHLNWQIRGVLSSHYVKNKDAVKNAKAIKFESGKVTISLQWEEDSLTLWRQKQGYDPVDENKKPLVTDFEVILESTRNQRGDGTVPEDSGKVLERLQKTPQEVFAMPGFDHQTAYDNQYAYQAAIYFIARIVQKAPPPTQKRSIASC